MVCSVCRYHDKQQQQVPETARPANRVLVIGNNPTAALQPSGEKGLLTPIQELFLARRIEEGDRSAKDKLVNANLRLVASVAQRYQGRGVSLEDLIQEGNLGLLHAAEKFDWRKGFRFSTYAVPWIRQTILRAIAKSGRAIRLPDHVVETIRRLARIWGELENRLGRQPTRAELAQAAEISEQKVIELLQRMAEPVSLERPVGKEGDQSLVEVLPAGESHSLSTWVVHYALQEEVARALKTLSPREREVLRLHYGLNGFEPHTLQEVGKTLHMTRERARQIEVRALDKLRRNPTGKRLWEMLAPD